MIKETYERVELDIEILEVENVITTSGEAPIFDPNQWELPFKP